MASAAGFYIGQIVEHRRFGYRGLVFGVDPDFQLSEAWYQNVARSRPPKDQPWYHVLVDGAGHSTYVAERHLAASADSSQISHPQLGQYFDRYNGERYFPLLRYN
jgi:heat shock protein HspQ